MDLAAIEEIKRLKHRYFRTLDLKQWEEFGDCLAEDVTARYGTQAMGEPLH
ncbi:MAG TPA: nuclear transport factor 2 family protein, partial [Nocardioides sp.]|nr:nuclear transport factor 2 family protein [Nocardioides sp.]